MSFTCDIKLVRDSTQCSALWASVSHTLGAYVVGFPPSTSSYTQAYEIGTAARVQQALALATKKEAETVVDAVVTALEATLLNNLGTNGFTPKLGSLGKFSVRHKSGILRRIPFTGKTILTKHRRKVRFISLGRLRQCEQVV